MLNHKGEKKSKVKTREERKSKTNRNYILVYDSKGPNLIRREAGKKVFSVKPNHLFQTLYTFSSQKEMLFFIIRLEMKITSKKIISQ